MTSSYSKPRQTYPYQFPSYSPFQNSLDCPVMPPPPATAGHPLGLQGTTNAPETFSCPVKCNYTLDDHFLGRGLN